MSNENDIKTAATENFINKFTGSVLIIGVNESNLPGSLIINFPVDLESTVVVRAETNRDLESVVDVKYRGMDDLPSSVQPALSVDLPSSVSVRPHNKMTGIVEVVEPPVIAVEYSPIEDTYVREDMPKLNYGRDGDQFVGTNWNGVRYRTLLRFDTSDLPPDKSIKRATLVLGLLNSRPAIPIGIYDVPAGQEWTEYGVTWDSQPEQGTLIKTYDSGMYAGLTEVDLTSYVTELYEGKREHNGFILKSLVESTLGSYKQYGTRETTDEALRPKLVVEYYDPTIYSYKREDLRGSVFVVAKGQSDLESSVVVAGYEGESDLEGSVTVRDPFAPVSDDMPSWAGVTRDEIPSSVWVLGRSHIDSSVVVRITTTLEPELESRVGVTRKYLPSSVYVRYYDDLDSSIHVKAKEVNDLESSVMVIAKSREGSVYVRYYDDLESTVQARVERDSDLHGSVTVIAKSRPGTVHVRPYSDLDTSVTARLTKESDLGGVVGVTRDDLPSQIYVRGFNDLDSSVLPRLEQYEDLASTVWVRSEFLAGTVTVRVEDYSELDFTVTLRLTEFEDLDSIVIPRIPAREDLDSSVGARQTELIEIPGTVIPRVVGASDLDSTISVEIAHNLPSSVYVRATDKEDIESSVGVRNDANHDQDSQVTVRVSEDSDLEGTVSIREVVDDDLDSNISIRSWGEHDLPGTLQPRPVSASDLPSVVDVWHMSEIEGSVTVMTREDTDLPGTVIPRPTGYSDLASTVEVDGDTGYVFIM